jgi:hypothetical protein
VRTTDDFLADYERMLWEAARARRRKPRRRLGVAWIAAPALVAIALIAIPSDDAPERAVSPRPEPAASFSILAQRPVARGALGRDVPLRRSGLRWNEARLAVQRSGVTAYVVPAAGTTTCLVAVTDRAGNSMTCGAPAEAPRSLIGVRIGLDEQRSAIVSLVPDGAATATLREDGADPATVAVTNNVIIALVGHAPATLRWRDRSGDHLAPLAPSPRWSDHTGPAGGGSIEVRTPVPGADGEVGVLAYRTNAGRVCLGAGPIQDGRVGRVGRNGFHALDPADAPGSCGEFSENFKDFGGIALARSQVDGFGDRPQAIVYGLLADASTTVRVTGSDGSAANATVIPVADPDELGGAHAAFAVVAAPGIGSRGAHVQLVRPDGAQIHAFDL